MSIGYLHKFIKSKEVAQLVILRTSNFYDDTTCSVRDDFLELEFLVVGNHFYEEI